jgi:hypothetical protein
MNPQSLQLDDNVLGALPVIIGHVQRQFFKRDAVIPVFLAYAGEAGYLRQAPDQLVSGD